MAIYFRSKADPEGNQSWQGASLRGLSELPFHLLSARMNDLLEATLSNPRFISAKLNAFSMAALVDDYDLVDFEPSSLASDAPSRHRGNFLRYLLQAFFPRTVEEGEELTDKYANSHNTTQNLQREHLVELCHAVLHAEHDWNIVYGAAEVLIEIDPRTSLRTFSALKNTSSPISKKEVPVFLWGMHVDKYPVTVAELKAAYPRYQTPWPTLEESVPATDVSWAEANVFAWKRGMRLLSVKDWLAAAGVVLDGRNYPWGNAEDSSRCNNKSFDYRHPTPVDTFDPVGASPYNVCDLMGNVWEFTSSVYPELTKLYRVRNADPRYPVGPLFTRSLRRLLLFSGNPTIMGGDYNKSLREGGLDGYGVRKRDICLDRHGSNNIGFRCARDFEAKDFVLFAVEVFRDCRAYFRKFAAAGWSETGMLCDKCNHEFLPDQLLAVTDSTSTPACVCRVCAVEELGKLAANKADDAMLYFGHALAAKVSFIRREPFCESSWRQQVVAKRWRSIIEEWFPGQTRQY